MNNLCQNKVIHFHKKSTKNKGKRGLSQDRLAKLADIANNTIIKIEQGENINPRLDTLKKIAKAQENVGGLINDGWHCKVVGGWNIAKVANLKIIYF